MNKSEVRVVSPSAFEWSLYIHWNLCVDTEERSPSVELRNSFWHLSLCLEKGGGWIGIFVHRADGGVPKTITYTLQLRSRYGSAKITKTHCFDVRGSAMSGEPKFFKRDKSWFDQHLTVITFVINNDTPLLTDRELELLRSAYQTQVPASVSCAVQTLVPHRVSRALQTLVPQRASHAVQTQVSHSVSCAIQTQVPEGVSCAIQTKVPEGVSYAVQTEDTTSVAEKEHNKAETSTSLDTKGIELLSEGMKELLVKSRDHDLKICVKDKEFRAHRNILSARSPVFAMMLAHDSKEKKTGIISIEDCDPESFEEFLLHVYSGRTENLTPSNALVLYYPADKYDFPVLKEWCVNLLKT